MGKKILILLLMLLFVNGISYAYEMSEVETGPDRFKDNGDGTVTDTITGLMWTKDAQLGGEIPAWEKARGYVGAMNAGKNENYGHTDWRIPDLKEIEKFTEGTEEYGPASPTGDPFVNVKANQTSYFCWNKEARKYGTGMVWDVFKWSGRLRSRSGEIENTFIWPVRGGSGAAETFILKEEKSLPKAKAAESAKKAEGESKKGLCFITISAF